MADTCPALNHGPHEILWANVPERIHNNAQLYPAHRRGACDWCGEHFIAAGD